MNKLSLALGSLAFLLTLAAFSSIQVNKDVVLRRLQAAPGGGAPAGGAPAGGAPAGGAQNQTGN